ncbi:MULTISPECIES: acrEF/envCD operon transcriptional regulator [unclassified Pseudocitrobacter]|uniref:acrEF/envCD operon transcriptional regulator n=1 Tax=unclassified Pseudocitrobacter TaxID=2638778 RepID=UPI0023E398AC|nr:MULTISPECIES: acrEF/envCD operon transcriptional regulator [unclassified Pseudocitrobacter]MDF3828675.1 acrEF/envCD operon transcriptional regulator [Pseudocitrobacter sp. 2023EL-00150]MEC5373687.1 acrEF/envCD operon transcriptional regulator [Pseudocitrobacter sp. MW920760]
MAKKTKAEALKTRQLLLETAIAQFAARGVTNTTLNDIADAAQVTRGAIYWHFENKVQLFNEIWLQQPALSELITLDLTAEWQNNPLRLMREKLILGLQYIATNPRQRALMQILYHKCEFHEEMLSEQYIREKIGFSHPQMRSLLIQAIAQGQLSPSLDLDVILIILHGCFSGIVKNWLMNQSHYDLFSQAPALVDNTLRMLVSNYNVDEYIVPEGIAG